MKCINLGCGTDLREGEDWINLDNHNSNGANVIFDLDKIFQGKEIPFKDNTFDLVVCHHVLHTFVYPLPIIQELIRICKPKGIIEIKTHLPNANNSSINMVRGHTQGMFRTIANNNYFQGYKKDSKKGLKCGLKINSIKYYTNSTNLSVRLATWFCNLLPYKLVEKTILMYLFPFLSVNVRYEKE